MKVTRIQVNQLGAEDQSMSLYDGKLSTRDGRKKIIAAMLTGGFLSTTVLTGCAGWTPSSSMYGAGAGGALGAIVGQATGKNTEGTLIGATVGSLLGYIVGNEIDKYNDNYNRQKIQEALETTKANTPSTWVNPDTGVQHTVIPQKAQIDPNQATQNSSGVCRPFTFKSEDGTLVNGVGCRDNYGNWNLVKAAPIIQRIDTQTSEKENIQMISSSVDGPVQSAAKKTTRSV